MEPVHLIALHGLAGVVDELMMTLDEAIEVYGLIGGFVRSLGHAHGLAHPGHGDLQVVLEDGIGGGQLQLDQHLQALNKSPGL